jgi:hypothetical protein
MIDGHTHHQYSNFFTLERLEKEGYAGMAVLSYLPVRPTGPQSIKDLFRWILEVEPKRYHNLRVYTGIGIHPRNIPESGLKATLNLLEEWLPKADILGEVGLETGSEEEISLLKKQLALAKRLDKPVIIHTPRKGKGPMLSKIRKLIGHTERVVVDHASIELIDEFIMLGTFVGLTVQPGKLAPYDVYRLLKKRPELVEKGILNSDCGREPSDPLAVKKTAKLLLRKGIPEEDIKRLIEGNFFRLMLR